VADPFDTLGLEARFDLDVAAAEQRHRELSRTLHPDRYANRPAAERRAALSRAIEVNDALRAVKDPIRRAEALLERYGVRLTEGDEPPAAPGFLMDMLELREVLADAQRHSDLDRVEQLAGEFEKHESRILGELSRAFAELQAEAPGTPAPRAVDQIGHWLGELRYYRRLSSEARAIQDEMA
jgi:molecular chaperone HscB